MFLWSACFDNIAYAILSHHYTIKHSMIKRTKNLPSKIYLLVNVLSQSDNLAEHWLCNGCNIGYRVVIYYLSFVLHICMIQLSFDIVTLTVVCNLNTCWFTYFSYVTAQTNEVYWKK